MVKERENCVWLFTRAGITPCYHEYSLTQFCGENKAKQTYYSSLTKCRKAVKDEIASKDSIIGSIDDWTEEQWRENDNYCLVINSGGSGIFSFRKIIIN
jgi:hypothetical protein